MNILWMLKIKRDNTFCIRHRPCPSYLKMQIDVQHIDKANQLITDRWCDVIFFSFFLSFNSVLANRVRQNEDSILPFWKIDHQLFQLWVKLSLVFGMMFFFTVRISTMRMFVVASGHHALFLHLPHYANLNHEIVVVVVLFCILFNCGFYFATHVRCANAI